MVAQMDLSLVLWWINGIDLGLGTALFVRKSLTTNNYCSFCQNNPIQLTGWSKLWVPRYHSLQIHNCLLKYNSLISASRQPQLCCAPHTAHCTLHTAHLCSAHLCQPNIRSGRFATKYPFYEMRCCILCIRHLCKRMGYSGSPLPAH